MTSGWWSLGLLALTLFLARRFLRPGPRTTPWSWPWDLGLAGLCGASVGLLSAFWFARYHLVGASMQAADFQAYCRSVAALREGSTAGWYTMRAVTPGLLPALLARYWGILDGLALASLLSSMVTGAALYLWGRALHSRMAGLAAALLACAASPLVLLTRELSFYPGITALVTLGAATVALAARWPTLPALALGSSGVGLMLLSDARGLVWALPAGALLALAAILPPSPQEPPENAAVRPPAPPWKRALVVLLPLVLSFWAGRAAFGPTDSLEVQLSRSASDTSGGGRSTLELPTAHGYRWGLSNPAWIPATLVHLYRASQVSGQDLAEKPRTALLRKDQVLPWLPVTVGAMGVAVLGLARRPRSLAALLATTLPFAVAWRGGATWEVTVRYLGLAMPMVPLVLGVALAVLLDPRGRDGPRTWAGTGLLALVVLGILPTWLSPVAPWRVPWETVPEALQTFLFVSTGREPPQVPTSPVCMEAIARDQAEGHPPVSRLHPWSSHPAR